MPTGSGGSANARPSPTGLLLCRDLFFVSKVTGTAKALGLRVDVAPDVAAALTRIRCGGARCLMIDLSMQLESSDLALLVSSARHHAIRAVLAFGSHVAAAQLEAARVAGCDDVMPKSRFAAQLPEILRQSLDQQGD